MFTRQFKQSGIKVSGMGLGCRSISGLTWSQLEAEGKREVIHDDSISAMYHTIQGLNMTKGYERMPALYKFITCIWPSQT